VIHGKVYARDGRRRLIRSDNPLMIALNSREPMMEIDAPQLHSLKGVVVDEIKKEVAKPAAGGITRARARMG
jgi:hypothetical protein